MKEEQSLHKKIAKEMSNLSDSEIEKILKVMGAHFKLSDAEIEIGDFQLYSTPKGGTQLKCGDKDICCMYRVDVTFKAWENPKMVLTIY